MQYQRIAAEEAFATPELFALYRQMLTSNSIQDPGLDQRLPEGERLRDFEWHGVGAGHSVLSAGTRDGSRAVCHGLSVPVRSERSHRDGCGWHGPRQAEVLRVECPG